MTTNFDVYRTWKTENGNVFDKITITTDSRESAELEAMYVPSVYGEPCEVEAFPA